MSIKLIMLSNTNLSFAQVFKLQNVGIKRLTIRYWSKAKFRFKWAVFRSLFLKKSIWFWFYYALSKIKIKTEVLAFANFERCQKSNILLKLNLLTHITADRK
jgi:hypothetical protein